MKWNERLRHECKSQGWTQRLLAEKIGTNTYTVNRWENGNAFPSPFYREQLSQIFGLDFEDSELFEADPARSKNTRKEPSLPWKGEKVQHVPYSRKKVSTLVGKTTPEVDLLWNVNENDSAEDALSPVAQPTSPDISAEPSLLMDPTIPQALENVSSLLGRHTVLIQVRQHLLATDNQTVMVLHGLPGSGKTALEAAVTTDGEVQAHFYDGILWACLEPHSTVLGQLFHWGKLLGVTPSQVGNIKSRAPRAKPCRPPLAPAASCSSSIMSAGLRMPRLSCLAVRNTAIC
jgi:transcriptional regulator with XRE-family HTH domain